MVMDFGFIKQLMMEQIHDPCDHGMILWDQDHDVLDALSGGLSIRDIFEAMKSGHHWLKLYQMDSVPTAENLAKHWYDRMFAAMRAWLINRGEESQEIFLEAIIVHETPNSVATYRPVTR